MSENKSLLSRIVTWTIIGLLAVLALKLVGKILGIFIGFAGMILGLVTFLLFTVGPIALVIWLGVKGWNAFTKPPAA